MVNGGAVRNFTNIINGMGKATGDQGQAFGDIIAKTNGTLSKLVSRSDQISDALTETSQLAKDLDAKNQALTEVMAAAGPATDTLAANADTVADVVQQAGDTSTAAGEVPVDRGHRHQRAQRDRATPTPSPRSWNDLVLAPDANLAALNRLMPPFIKVDSQQCDFGAGQHRPAGARVDPRHRVPAATSDLHGPKRYNWAQMAGTFKYTLWRLQQRVVGQGPDVPQVPVLPSPTEPGELIVAPPPPPGPPPSEPPP